MASHKDNLLLGVPIVNATLEAWAKVFVFELEKRLWELL
jgi:hypothetical protein